MMDHNEPDSEAALELIERYLAENLSLEEKRSFEERLKTDIAWKEQVEEVRLMQLAIGEDAVETLLNKSRSLLEPKVKTVVLQWRRLVVAASLLLCIVGVAWWLIYNTNSNQKLFTIHYKADPGLPTFMGVSDKFDFENGMVAYKIGEYSKALKIWDELLAKNPQNDTLNYFVGSAYLADGDALKSVSFFNKVVEEEASVFRSDAHWYLSLAWLKMDDKEKALTELKQTEHSQKDALLKKLTQQ